jgi:soluble lytic murein transglycosylase-like protein
MLVCAVVFCNGAPAHAQDAIAPAYARALQAFNPDLDATHAVRLARDVIAEADAQGLDARLLVALIAVESSWHPDAVSSAGASGLGQLMPETAAQLRVDSGNPEDNIHGAAVYLRSLLDRYRSYDPSRRYALALAAYNAGPGAVDRYGGVPPYAQTQRYVTAVLALWARLSGAR